MPLFLRKLINVAFLAWIRISVFILLLNHGGTLSSHRIVSRGIELLKMLRTVFFENNYFFLDTSLQKGCLPIKYFNGSPYKLSIWIFIATNRFNISNLLIRTCTWVRNVNFSENFAYVFSGWLLIKLGCNFNRRSMQVK